MSSFYKNDKLVMPDQDELKNLRWSHGYRLFCDCGSCRDGRKNRNEIGYFELMCQGFGNPEILEKTRKLREQLDIKDKEYNNKV